MTVAGGKIGRFVWQIDDDSSLVIQSQQSVEDLHPALQFKGWGRASEYVSGQEIEAAFLYRAALLKLRPPQQVFNAMINQSFASWLRQLHESLPQD